MLKFEVLWKVKWTYCQAVFHKNARFALKLTITAQFTAAMIKVQSEERAAGLGGLFIPGLRGKTWKTTVQGKDKAVKQLEVAGVNRDLKTMKDLCRLHGSCWVTATALPATPVFDGAAPQTEDMGCAFPNMRFEDLRLTSLIPQGRIFIYGPLLLPMDLARAGYYFDLIYGEIRCFCCGRSYQQGHFPTCTDGRRRECNIPINQCGIHRQQLLQDNNDLRMIVNAPGFNLRDHSNEHRGSARQRQNQPRFRLPPVLCPACWNIPANEVVYSCGHRLRSCETCAPLQELCPYCGQGTSNNPTMTNYRLRTTVPTTSDTEKCRVCRHNRANVVLLPCRHLTVCESCSHQITSCPRCRRQIDDRVPVVE